MNPVSCAIQRKTHMSTQGTSADMSSETEQMRVPSQLHIISLHGASVSSPCLLWCIKIIVIVLYQCHAYCGVGVAEARALNLAVYSSDVSFGDEQLGDPPVLVNALRNRAIALAITEVHLDTVCTVTFVTIIVIAKVVFVIELLW